MTDRKVGVRGSPSKQQDKVSPTPLALTVDESLPHEHAVLPHLQALAGAQLRDQARQRLGGGCAWGRLSEGAADDALLAGTQEPALAEKGSLTPMLRATLVGGTPAPPAGRGGRPG
jgi:hypothetical protein